MKTKQEVLDFLERKSSEKHQPYTTHRINVFEYYFRQLGNHYESDNLIRFKYSIKKDIDSQNRDRCAGADWFCQQEYDETVEIFKFVCQ